MSGRPCWRRNGVWGRERPRCERLQQVQHCRNCEVYVGEGRRLLERLAMAREGGPERETAELPKREPEGPAQLVFRVNGNWLALPASWVEQVAPSLALRPLPHQRHTAVRGLVNVGGRLRLCLSLTETLGIPRIPREGNDPTRGIFERVVALAAPGLRFAFRAGEVRGLYRHGETDTAPLEDGEGRLPELARGVWTLEVRPGERVRCVLLDPERVVQAVRERIA